MSTIGLRMGARLHPTTASGADERAPLGISANLGTVMVVAASFAAATIPATNTVARIALIMSVVASFGVLTADPRAVAVVVGIAFLLFDGFLVDRFGELAWHGSADALRLIALVAAGGAGVALGTARLAWARRG